MLFRSVYHLGAQMLNWIRDYLTGRMQQVNVGNFLSSAEMVSSGVPQGRSRVDPYIPQQNKSGGPDGTYLYILHEYCMVLCQPLSPLAVQVIIKSFQTSSGLDNCRYHSLFKERLKEERILQKSIDPLT